MLGRFSNIFHWIFHVFAGFSIFSRVFHVVSMILHGFSIVFPWLFHEFPCFSTIFHRFFHGLSLHPGAVSVWRGDLLGVDGHIDRAACSSRRSLSPPWRWGERPGRPNEDRPKWSRNRRFHGGFQMVGS